MAGSGPSLGPTATLRIPGRNMRRRRATDRVMRALLGLAAIVAVIPLLVVVVYVVIQGLPGPQHRAGDEVTRPGRDFPAEAWPRRSSGR